MPESDQVVNDERYKLIPRTLIFLTRGDSLLLLRGDPEKGIWPDQYNGVGGHIEAGEDVLTAARRELEEETGLTHQNLRLVGTVTIDTGQETGIGLYVYKGEHQGGTPSPSREGDVQWVSIKEISSLPLVEDLPTLLPKVLSIREDEPPFSAHYHYDKDDQLVVRFAD